MAFSLLNPLNSANTDSRTTDYAVTSQDVNLYFDTTITKLRNELGADYHVHIFTDRLPDTNRKRRTTNNERIVQVRVGRPIQSVE